MKDNKIRLVTTFNQRNPPMKKILKKYDSWLDKTKKDIKAMDIQTVYRKARKPKATTSERKDQHNTPDVGIFDQLQ